MTVVVESAADLTAPARYRFPELVADYTERLFGTDRDQSVLYQRMRNWPAADGHAIDQIATLAQMLAASPDTRAASFTLWRPEDDLGSAFPVSPVSGCFRIISGRLQLQLRVKPRPIVFHMWSAHIYEDDRLAHVAIPARALGSGNQS